MAEPRRSSTSSTRSRRRESARSSNLDVFSDEYSLDLLQVSDGFRPQGSHGDAHSSIDHGSPQPAHTDGSAEDQAQQDYELQGTAIGRNSASGKSSYNERRPSVMSRFNCPRQLPAHHPRASLQKETPTSTVFRSTSLASTTTMPRTQSPYQGATGPSHPYAMYPQDIGVLRTPSTTTTSSMRPSERSYAGPTGPAQPYGLYPQNTVPEDDVAPNQSFYAPAPVGFPGRTQNYTRQRGPETEDADDLVGPDGYTEQLPPYTRYPDGVPPKTAEPGPASILSAQGEHHNNSDVTLIDSFQPQGSIPGSTPGSIPESIPESSRQLFPEPLRRNVIDNPSSTELTAVAASESSQDDEGGNFKEKVKERGKRKVCFGTLRVWWVIAALVLLVVAVAAGVVGAVVGRARGKKQAESASSPINTSPTPSAAATVIVTTTFLPDATPLPTTYPNLPALPTGTFYVPLRAPTISNSTCLNSHVSAWDCSDKADLKLGLTEPMMVSVSPRFLPAPNRIYFGHQPPQLDAPVPLTLMADRAGMDKGPAWYFRSNYTKIVVVPEDDFLDVEEDYSRRWLDPRGGRQNSGRLDARRNRGIAQPPARPWFCYWNDTILEGFIYVTQNSSTDSQPVSRDYTWPTRLTDDVDDSGQPLVTKNQYIAQPADSTQRRRRTTDPSPTLAYTKDVKIEEGRNPHTESEPYCVHMQIMNDGSASTLPEKAVPLDELETLDDGSVHRSTRMRERGDVEARSLVTSACECEWHVF